MLAEAEATDLAEDEEFGEDKRGDEVPPELARRESRLAKLRTAKEAIEAEAREKAAKKAADKAEADGADDTVVAEAAADAAAEATPAGRSQRSFTDPESRMMKTTDGFHYAYNAQAVVDEYSQVVLSAQVTDQAGDVAQLIPMIEAATDSLSDAGIEGAPGVVLADCQWPLVSPRGRSWLFPACGHGFSPDAATVFPAVFIWVVVSLLCLGWRRRVGSIRLR